MNKILKLAEKSQHNFNGGLGENRTLDLCHVKATS